MVHIVGYDTMGYMGLFEQPVLRSASQGGWFCQWRHLQTGHEMRSESWDKPTTDKRVGLRAFQQNSREMLGTVYLCDHPTLWLVSRWLRTISKNMFCRISRFSSKFHWLNFIGWILWYQDILVIYMWCTCELSIRANFLGYPECNLAIL